jgi:spore coat protein U-like protein
MSLANAKADNSIGIAQALATSISEGGLTAATALSSGYAKAMNFGKVDSVADAIARACQLVSACHPFLPCKKRLLQAGSPGTRSVFV